MNQLQRQLDSQYPNSKIQILGINMVGHEAGNSLMASGKTLPLLQDVDSNGNTRSDVWDELWDIEWRDMVFLNSSNETMGIINLTEYDLAEVDNYEATRQILVDIAHDQAFWQNAADPLDIDNDGLVGPADVLACINEINLRQFSDAQGKLPMPMPQHWLDPLVDVNGDGLLSAVDPLLVINHLNERALAPGQSVFSSKTIGQMHIEGGLTAEVQAEPEVSLNPLGTEASFPSAILSRAASSDVARDSRSVPPDPLQLSPPPDMQIGKIARSAPHVDGTSRLDKAMQQTSSTHAAAYFVIDEALLNLLAHEVLWTTALVR